MERMILRGFRVDADGHIDSKNTSWPSFRGERQFHGIDRVGVQQCGAKKRNTIERFFTFPTLLERIGEGAALAGLKFI